MGMRCGSECPSGEGPQGNPGWPRPPRPAATPLEVDHAKRDQPESGAVLTARSTPGQAGQACPGRAAQ